MVAYKPPLSGRLESKMHLLDFNERTSALPKQVLEACANWCNAGHTQVYPEYGELTEKLAEYCGCDAEKVFLGNGSDQLIDCIFRACIDDGDEVLLPAPSFSMYKQCAMLASASIATYNMLDDPFADLENKLKNKPVLTVICSPNNPTGTLLETVKVKELAQKHPETWFMVDEAYHEFSLQSVLQEIDLPDNVLVLRTFSKAFGLASMRIGYMISSTTMIEQLAKIRGPYDINQMAVIAALAALEHRDEILQYRDELIKENKPNVKEALDQAGVKYLTSHANFFLIPNPPEGLAEHFKQGGIRIRNIKIDDHPNAFRLSIGDKEATKLSLDLLSSFSKLNP